MYYVPDFNDTNAKFLYQHNIHPEYFIYLFEESTLEHIFNQIIAEETGMDIPCQLLQNEETRVMIVLFDEDELTENQYRALVDIGCDPEEWLSTKETLLNKLFPVNTGFVEAMYLESDSRMIEVSVDAIKKER